MDNKSSSRVPPQRHPRSPAADAKRAAADSIDAAHAGLPQSLRADADVDPIGLHGADDCKFIAPLFALQSGPADGLPEYWWTYRGEQQLVRLARQLRTGDKPITPGGFCEKAKRTRCEQACDALVGALASRMGGKVLKYGGALVGFGSGYWTTSLLTHLAPSGLEPLFAGGGIGYTCAATAASAYGAEELHFHFMELYDGKYRLDDEAGPFLKQLNDVKDQANIVGDYLFVTRPGVNAPAAVMRVNEFLFHAYISFDRRSASATFLLPKEYLDAGWPRSDGLSKSAHREAQVQRLLGDSVKTFDFHDPATSGRWREQAGVVDAVRLRANDYIFVTVRLDMMIAERNADALAPEIAKRTAEVDVSEQVKARVRERQA